MRRAYLPCHLAGDILQLVMCSSRGDIVEVDPTLWRSVGPTGRDNILKFAGRLGVKVTEWTASASAAKPESPKTTATTISVAGSS